MEHVILGIGDKTVTFRSKMKQNGYFKIVYFRPNVRKELWVIKVQRVDSGQI